MVQCVADEMATTRQREEMLPLLKRHEIQVLRRAGFSQAEVARRTGVSSREIRRIDGESEVSHVDDAAARKERRIGRPSKAEPFREVVCEILRAEPGTLSVEVLRRAKLRGYAGSKTALYALIAGIRPPKAAPVVRFEGVAGEFCQHDFGHCDVRFLDGTKRRIHFFASRLKWSRWVEVSLVENEQVETLVRGVAEHYERMGGRPLLAVFDRPKTVVIKSAIGREVEEWNATFAQAMLDIGVGVEVCAARSGNQKGSVERLVGWVKNSFFKQRRFVDDEDLREQLREWLAVANTKTVSRATGVTPESRIVEERARLRPLKVAAADLALRFPVVVGPTAEVLHEGVPYSMPPGSMHIAGTLYLYRERVRIVAGNHKTEQRRRTKGEPPDTPSEHRTEMLAAVHGRRAKLYYMREQLLRLGGSSGVYITHLVHRRPRTWMRDVEAIFELLQVHGSDAVRAALAALSEKKLFGAEYVRRELAPSGDPSSEAWTWKGKASVSGNGDGSQPRRPSARRTTRRSGGAEPRRGAR